VFLLGAARVRRLSFGWSAPLRRLAALGVLNPGVAYALGLLGLASISASLSVLIWAAEPVLILALAVLLLRERIPWTQAAAMAVAVVGVLLIVYQGRAAGDAVGTALTVAAVGACALYTVATRRLLLHDTSLTVVIVQQAAALAFALVLAVTVRAFDDSAWAVQSIPATAWAGAVVSGVLYYGLAFWFFLSALGRVSASVAGAFLPLIPVFGVAAGHLVGERLSERQWLGAVIVVTAVTVVAVLQGRSASHPDRAPSVAGP
jgi:drug/metabolite transporter (DMT)-like permease